MRRATTSGAARATSTRTTPAPSVCRIRFMPPTGPASRSWFCKQHRHLPVRQSAPFWLVTNYGLIEDNATKIHGKHEFQFGAGFRYERIDKSSVATAGSFAQVPWPLRSTTRPRRRQSDATPQTGFGLANFELGVLNYNASFQRRWFHFRRPELTSTSRTTGRSHAA